LGVVESVLAGVVETPLAKAASVGVVVVGISASMAASMAEPWVPGVVVGGIAGMIVPTPSATLDTPPVNKAVLESLEETMEDAGASVVAVAVAEASAEAEPLAAEPV
jgi:hypothetical protein